MIDADLKSLVSSFRGTIGIVIKNLNSDRTIHFNRELLFPAASLIKLPILWEFFHQCATGSIDPEEKIELRAEDMVIGFGVLRQLSPGLNLRLRDLAVLMSVVSDNTATNLLIDKLGFDSINSSIQQLGLSSTALHYKMFDPRDWEQDNFTTPADIALMLETFVQRKQLLGQYGDEPLKILEGQQCKNKLPLGMPKGIRLAHKTGESIGVEHDAGILLVRGTKTIAVVMTKDLEDNYDGVKLCQNVARLVFQNISFF
jgi:beta-lactamase class A